MLEGKWYLVGYYEYTTGRFGLVHERWVQVTGFLHKKDAVNYITRHGTVKRRLTIREV